MWLKQSDQLNVVRITTCVFFYDSHTTGNDTWVPLNRKYLLLGHACHTIHYCMSIKAYCWNVKRMFNAPSACANRVLSDYYIPSGNSRHVSRDRQNVDGRELGRRDARCWPGRIATKVFMLKSMKLLNAVAHHADRVESDLRRQESPRRQCPSVRTLINPGKDFSVSADRRELGHRHRSMSRRERI